MVEYPQHNNETKVKNEPLRFGYISQHIPPYVTHNNGNTYGVDFDIAAKVGEILNKNVVHVSYSNHRELINDLNNGLIDFSIQDPGSLALNSENIASSDLIYKDRLVALFNRSNRSDLLKTGCIIHESYCKNIDGIIPVFNYYDTIRLLDDDIISRAIVPYATFISNNIVSEFEFLSQNLRKRGAILLGKSTSQYLEHINTLIKNNTMETDFWSSNLDFQYSQFSNKAFSNKKLRYTVEKDIYPALYINPVTSQPDGYVVDILNYISNRTLLSFEYIESTNGKHADTMLKESDIDFLPFAGIDTSYADSNLGRSTVNYTSINIIRIDIKGSLSKEVGILARTQRAQNYFESIRLTKGDRKYYSDLTSLIEAVIKKDIKQLYVSQEVITPNLILNSRDILDIESIEEVTSLPVGMIFHQDVESEFGYMNHFLRTLDEKIIHEYRGKYTGDGYYFGIDRNIFFSILGLLLAISSLIFVLYRISNNRLKIDLKKEKNEKEKTDQMLNWFTSLLEDIPVGLVLTNKSGKKIISNRQYRKYQEKYNIDSKEYKDDDSTKTFNANGAYLTYRTVPFLHPNDGRSGYLTIWTDVTSLEEQKMALIESNQIANTALSARSKFTAMITHELRTPIAGIIGLLEVVETKSHKSEDFQSIILSLKASAKELNQHVDEILDISKSESGEMTLDLHSCSLVSELDSITKQYRVICAKSNIDFKVNFNPTQWYMHTQTLRVSDK